MGRARTWVLTTALVAVAASPGCGRSAPLGFVPVADGTGSGTTGPAVVPDVAVAPTPACKKVDFLFVLDNSGSMRDEQQGLIRSFPGFIAEIEQTLDDNDYHIMVVDTDAGSAFSCYESMFGTFDCGLWCSEACPRDCNCECDAVPCAPFENQACDDTLGAGRSRGWTGMQCPMSEGRFLTQDHANLSAAFACAAQVGIDGSRTERPMQAMVEALTTQNAVGQCNEGFLRDDALLVVTVITDEEDDGASPGDPSSWRAAVVEAKGGDPDAVVVLALVGDTDLPAATCAPLDPDDGQGADAAPRLRAFASQFTRGAWGPVCAPDYAPFFENAVAIIDAACDELPGG